MPDYLLTQKRQILSNGQATKGKAMEMTQPQPKIALVTGASRGLGRNTAIALAAKGVDVIGTYLSNKAEAEATAAAIRAHGRKALMFRLDTGEVSGFAAFAADLKAALAE